MTRLEMIQELAKNPKRKAKLIKNEWGTPGIEHECIYEVFENGDVGRSDFNFCILPVRVKNDKSEWEIIEPPKELRKMSFGEALYIITNKFGKSYYLRRAHNGRIDVFKRKGEDDRKMQYSVR